MNRSLSPLAQLAVAAAILAAGLPATALAGPDPMPTTRTFSRHKKVVTWHKKIVDEVLIACGVVEPPPVYLPPGYLETTGPSPMLLYRSAGPRQLRRVAPAPDTAEKPASTHAAAPASSPAANPGPVAAPVAPIPEPVPAGPEPGLLPDPNGGDAGSQSRTDELLSYFQRQRPTNRPANPQPVPGGEVGPTGPASEPSFLQAPQAPEQPVLPPSRATYRVVP